MYPEFKWLKRRGASIWIGRKFADPAFVDRLADADRLFDDPSCRIIKDQRKIKVARIEVIVGDQLHSIYLKRFNVFSLRHKLVSPFGPSGAFRALKGAAILRGASIRTAPPVAAVENRTNGILMKSFYISEEIAEAKTADAYWIENFTGPRCDRGRQRRNEFIGSLACLFQSLHERGVYHNDLKDANILVDPRSEISSRRFVLLDLEGVKLFEQISERRRTKNLVQLNRTLGRYLRRSDKLRFIKTYFAAASPKRAEIKRRIRQIVATSDRLDIAKGLRINSESAARESTHG